jgi:hypothetical protein
VPSGECVFSNDTAACQYLPKSCTMQSDCPAPLACASDYHCRNLCTTAAGCNVLGITGDVCATDKAGVHFCAPPSDVDGGVLADPAPPGANTSAPVMELDAGVSDGAASSDASGDTTIREVGPGDTGSDVSADVRLDVSGDTGSDVTIDAPPLDAPVVCSPPCAQGETCIGGDSGPTCIPCGTAGLVCCEGQTCGANLSCSASGICECGAANEACCTGTSCNSGLSCETDDAGASTCACGEIGTRCCPGVDGGTASCSSGGTCAGSKCGCIVQFATGSYAQEYGGTGSTPAVVLRTDGTVWASDETQFGGAGFVEIDGNAGPLLASSVALSTSGVTNSPQSPIGCAIASGLVWCFPTGETLTDSTDLGAGLGPTDTTSSPVQVQTPVNGGTPLSNITQIAGGEPKSGSNFCAAASDGSAWCWGYGQDGELGNGTTANSSFASQVMANASTPFANIVEVRVGAEVSCARRTDGSVWCWGTNGEGELAVPSSTTPHNYYPIQIPFSGTTAQTTATRLAASLTTVCAIMQDTSVVCWGNNSYAQAGAPSSTLVVGPTSILVAAGGAPLTGIVDLAGDAESICAKTSDLALLCWGADASGPYPAAYENSASTAVIGIVAPLSQSPWGLGYIDPDGLLVTGGTSGGPVPPCTNLLP